MGNDPVEPLAQSLSGELAALEVLIAQGPAQQSEQLRVAAEKIRIAVEELHVAEEELRQQNDELLATRGAMDAERRRYQGLFELAPDGYVVTDLHGMIREANRAAGNLLGLAPRHLLGKPLAVFVAREDEHRFRLRVTRAARTTRPLRWEFRLQPRRGKPFPVSATVGAKRTVSGAAEELRWLLRDVTEDKRLEGELRESEARFRSTFENAAVGMAHVSFEGRFLRVNDRLCEITGYSREELLERTYQEITVSCDLEADVEQTERLRRGEMGSYAVEKRYVRRDGSEVWVQLHASVLRDRHGQPLCFVGVMQDVSGRKQVETDLRQSEARFRTLADAMPQLVWSALPDGTVDYYNSRVEQYAGITRNPDGSWDWGPAVHPDDLRPTMEAWEAALRVGSLYEFEHRVQMKDGSHRWHLSRGVPLRDGEKRVVRWFGTSTDIQVTKDAEEEILRAKEKAEAAAVAKSQFLANMSHEIRTPLGGVLGMAQILDRTRLDPDQRECVDAILLSGKLLLGIVNDVLDMSRIEAGRLALESVEFALRAAIEDTVRLHADAAFGKGLELACRVGPKVPSRVVGDPGRLRQILVNLVGNAIKFTESGRVVVRSAVVEERGPVAVVRFDVEDTGIGIARETQRTIFDPFTQVDASATRRFGGSGLGLSICRRLVEAMGGAIGVQSEPGGGSTFWLTVPFAVAEAAASPQSLCMRSLVLAPPTPGRDFLVEQLDRLGVWAEVVQDGAHAEQQLDAADRDQPYHALLVDLDLSGEDPIALARRLARSAPRPAVIFLVSSPAQTVGARAKGGDGEAYLLKPVAEEELASCLRGILAGTGCAPDSARVTAAGDETYSLAAGRILVAEDNRVNQLVVRRFLERDGYQADILENGAQVVEAALSTPYDAVLMDWQLPGMDGIDAAREIRRREAPGRRVPIIAMTAHALEGDREKCLEAGMDDYLTKPVNADELADKLARVVGQARPVPETDAEIDTQGLAHTRRRLRVLSAKLPADTVREIVRAFLESLGAGPGALEALLEGGDLLELEREAHRFRGTCTILGTTRLIELVRALEAAAKSSELAHARSVLDDIRREAELVAGFLESVRPPAP